MTLHDGQTLDRVYIVAEAPYIRMWGVYPEDDRGKKWIRIEDVASIAESPTRLPAKIANRLYEAGESGMGYTIFTVGFSDGTKQACAAGNAIDFIHYPENNGPKDVVSVKPHVGRDRNPLPGPAYFWCIYSDGELPAHIYPAQASKGTLLTLVRRFLRHVRRRR